MAARKKVEAVAGEIETAAKVRKLKTVSFVCELLGIDIDGTPDEYNLFVYEYDGERGKLRRKMNPAATFEDLQKYCGAGTYFIEMRRGSRYVKGQTAVVSVDMGNGNAVSGGELLPNIPAATAATAATGNGLGAIGLVLQTFAAQVGEQMKSMQESNRALLQAIAQQKDPFSTAVEVAAKIREFQQLTQPTAPPSAPSASGIDSETLDRLEDLLEAFEDKEDGDGGEWSWIKPFRPVIEKAIAGLAAAQPAPQPEKPLQAPNQTPMYQNPSQGQFAPQRQKKPAQTGVSVPESIRPAAQWILLCMESDGTPQAVSVEKFVTKALSIVQPDGNTLPQYATLVMGFKLSEDLAISTLRDYGFPVAEHEAWTRSAIAALRSALK